MLHAFRFISRTEARKRVADVVPEVDQRSMGRGSEVLRDLLRQRYATIAMETFPSEYLIQIIEGAANNLRCIDNLIAAHAKISGLDRIVAASLVVIRVAVWKMLGNPEDVSATIAIDEVISIVKSLSTDATSSSVNTVLDVIHRGLGAPTRTRREALVAEDELALDSEDGPALDLEDKSKEPTGEHDDAEDAPLLPEPAESSEEGPANEFSDEELTELGELLDEHRSTHTPGAANHEGGPP